jgi:Na+-driven multidrug efflux pump
VLIFLLKYDVKIRFRLPMLKSFDRYIMANYLKIGAPVILSDLLLALGMNMLSAIMGRMGSDMVAANSIANVVWQLTTIMLMGVASASGAVTGNTVGVGEFEKAQQYGVTFVIMSICIGASEKSGSEEFHSRIRLIENFTK